jgi:hypothetical protein
LEGEVYSPDSRANGKANGTEPPLPGQDSKLPSEVETNE